MDEYKVMARDQGQWFDSWFMFHETNNPADLPSLVQEARERFPEVEVRKRTVTRWEVVDL